MMKKILGIGSAIRKTISLDRLPRAHHSVQQLQEVAPMDNEKKRILDTWNPSPLDDTHVEMIESGNEELSDSLFFELIADSPAYLSTRPFQKRIAEWQEILHSPIFGEEDGNISTEQKVAKLNLRKIGQVLAIRKQGRPKEAHEIAISIKFRHCKKNIEQFLQMNRNLTSTARITEFKKCFPYWADVKGLRTHRTAQEIAISIISIKYSISKRLIRDIIKTLP